MSEDLPCETQVNHFRHGHNDHTGSHSSSGTIEVSHHVEHLEFVFTVLTNSKTSSKQLKVYTNNFHPGKRSHLPTTPVDRIISILCSFSTSTFIFPLYPFSSSSRHPLVTFFQVGAPDLRVPKRKLLPYWLVLGNPSMFSVCKAPILTADHSRAVFRLIDTRIACSSPLEDHDNVLFCISDSLDHYRLFRFITCRGTSYPSGGNGSYDFHTFDLSSTGITFTVASKPS